MKISANGKSKEYGSPVTLLTACRDLGVPLYAPCGGRGVCGGCRVTAHGELSPVTDEERERLTEEERARGVRLACHAYANGDVEINVDNEQSAVYEPQSVKEVGVAVDIGTTTVAVTTVDMATGKRIGELTRRNPQSVYGADVISRITAAGEVGVGKLQALIRGCIDDMRQRLGAPDTAKTVIVGNTTMLHIWAGIDPTPLGRAPFTPTTLFGCEIDGAYLPRCVSAYVGADAVASAIAAGVPDSGNVIVADIGTNGEVIAVFDGEIKACAAAAGPALEGAGIACGMTAASGAIDRVTVSDGEIDIHTVGDAEPVGICGSGLIDAVAALLDLGVIDKTGYMARDFVLAPNVRITPSDIRALQLAKGAVRAAIDVACGEHHADKLYLSGGFGSGLDSASCARIGLIPPSCADDIVILGNGAISGAEMMLLDDKSRKNADVIARDAAYIELSGSSEFERRFVESLNF